MHIASGRFKGMPLIAPPGLRATEGKVRQAIFNILGEFVEGIRVLDGFAGSGALGIEALSRGAEFAAFIDADPDSVIAIRDNLAKLGGELGREHWRVLHLDITAGLRELGRQGIQFDLVILDPPYRSDEGKKALQGVGEYAILAPAGHLVIEHDRRSALPSTCGLLSQWKQHRYGQTVLSFYQATS